MRQLYQNPFCMTQKILVYSSKQIGFTYEALNGYPITGTDPISHLGTDAALSVCQGTDPISHCISFFHEGALERFTQLRSMISRAKHNFTRWLALWAALIIGHLAAILFVPGEMSFCVQSFAEILGVVLLPLSAVVCAAIGPLSMICFILFLFRVRGGTLTAITSLILGSVLIYSALIWFFRIWLRTEKSLVRRLGWLFFLSYAASATFSLMFVSSRM